MKSATIIFPHQLFKQYLTLSKEREICLVEVRLFFSGARSPLRFHKKKLLLHRASMRAYKKRLESQGRDGLYWRFIYHHRDFFKKNPRMKVMVNQIDRMGKERMKQHLAVANHFLERL